MSDRNPDVLFTLREMAEHMRPCFVHRHEGVTVILVQPDTDRLSLLTYFVDELTTAEQNTIRGACGWPPVGHGSVPDSWVEGHGPLVPPSLLVPASWDKPQNR